MVASFGRRPEPELDAPAPRGGESTPLTPMISVAVIPVLTPEALELVAAEVRATIAGAVQAGLTDGLAGFREQAAAYAAPPTG